MTEAVRAAQLFILLLASSGATAYLRRFLPERHRSAEAIELVQLVVTMLVTLAAIVLGLLTTSVKSSFDAVSGDLVGFGAAIIRLDHLLEEYGPQTDPARALLRSYTAAAIASTWTDEPKPAGNYYPKHPAMLPNSIEAPALGDILNGIETIIRRLQPEDRLHQRLAADALRACETMQERRWRLIEEAKASISSPFYTVLVLWLVIVFACFGLSAPRSVLSFVTIALAAISMASVMFVILDLDTPFGGFFTVSSWPMRDALAHLGG